MLVSIIYSLFIEIEHHLTLLMLWALYICDRYDDLNTEKLRKAFGNSENKDFYFDPRIIDWEDYILHMHIPGLVKYGFK